MYEIRKGWPSYGAIDEVLKAAPGQTIKEGMIVTVSNGEASVANFTSAASPNDPMVAFIMGAENLTNTFTGLMSACVIEVDSDLYAAGTYTAGDALTAKDGQFAPAGSSKVIGRVLKFDAISGRMRVMWFSAA